MTKIISKKYYTSFYSLGDSLFYKLPSWVTSLSKAKKRCSESVSWLVSLLSSGRNWQPQTRVMPEQVLFLFQVNSTPKLVQNLYCHPYTLALLTEKARNILWESMCNRGKKDCKNHLSPCWISSSGTLPRDTMLDIAYYYVSWSKAWDQGQTKKEMDRMAIGKRWANVEDRHTSNIKSAKDLVAIEGNLNTPDKEVHSRSRTQNLEECIAGVRSHAQFLQEPNPTPRTNMNNKQAWIRGGEAQSGETRDSRCESLTPCVVWFLPSFKVQR